MFKICGKFVKKSCNILNYNKVTFLNKGYNTSFKQYELYIKTGNIITSFQINHYLFFGERPSLVFKL